jgi:mannose-1-phosphate guanylyltransferase
LIFLNTFFNTDLMKTFFLFFSLLYIGLTVANAQAPPTFNRCDDDTSFFRIVTSRPMPSISCDTVYLITKKNYNRIFVTNHQHSSIDNSLKKELELQKQQTQNMQQLANRHKQHADSLEYFLKEKDTQLSTMTSLAKDCTANTDAAIAQAKKYKLFTILLGIVSIALLVLLAIK